jgi:hypothetical protein
MKSYIDDVFACFVLFLIVAIGSVSLLLVKLVSIGSHKKLRRRVVLTGTDDVE